MISARRRILHLALFVLLGLGAALVVLPARWLIALVPADSPIGIVDASGTIWAGHARVALGPPDYRRMVPDPIRWRVGWVDGLPQVDIEHPWLSGPLALRPAWRGLALSAQSLTLPASALSVLHAGIRQIDPQGTVRLRWPATSLNASPASGAAALTVDWQHAASALSPIRPLGSYHASLQQTAEGLDLRLDTRAGPLLLKGGGQLRGGRLRFDGEASIAPETDAQTRAALIPLLQNFGPLANGRARLRFH